jgi:hypothetical protein
LATWASEESKRDLLDKIFQKLTVADHGKTVIFEMARALSEQTSFADLRSSTVAGIENIESAPCYHVVGEAPNVGQVHVWIGTGDGLIRKVQMRLAGFLQEEIHRDIHVNEEIPQTKFEP